MLLITLMTTPIAALIMLIVILETVSSLESSSARLFNWFQQNAMKANVCLIIREDRIYSEFEMYIPCAMAQIV